MKADRGELIALRTLTEQRWAYERVMEHLSYAEMRSLANRKPSKGGLGYDLSESALKGLVRGYRDRMAEVEAHSLEEHRERELADADARQRAAANLIGVAERSIVRAEQVQALDVHAVGLALKGIAQHRAESETRRKLLGLDAPTVAKLDITTHDAVTDELNEMLARAGHAPIEKVPND